MLRPGGQVGFSDPVFDRPPTAAEDRALRALLYQSARELLTGWPGLFAAAGFQLGTVRDIQAQTLPTWQHVQAVYRQHAAQIRVRYGRRLGPGYRRPYRAPDRPGRRCDQTLRQLPGGTGEGCIRAGTAAPLRLPSAAGLLPWPEHAHRRCRRDTGRCCGLLLSLLVRGPLSPPRTRPGPTALTSRAGP